MKILHYIFFLTCTFSFAQTIQVIDQESLEGIPFASIEIYEMQTERKCNTEGVIQLNDIKINTAIIISAKGYQSKSFMLKDVDQDTYLVKLKKAHILLNEVVVSPTTGLVQKNNVSNVVLKKIGAPNQLMTPNLMGIINSVPGVYSIHTGSGISKPVIRGLSGLKVVTFLNGLRIENQQWANDHGLNFTDMGIKSVEIVKGPSSLLYGADALGGVLYFVDEDYLGPNSFKSSLETRFESNTLSTNNIARIKLASKKLRFNLYAGYINSHDYQIPNGSYIVNSRFNGKSLKAALGYNKDNWVFNLRYNHNSNEIGLPGHTHSADPDPSEFQSETLNKDLLVPFQLISDHYISIENKLIFNKSVLKLNTGFTSNSLTEHEKVTIPGIKMLLTNFPYNLSYTNYLNEDLKWISGAQGMFTKNKNDEAAQDTLIPNSTSIDYGAYSLLHYSKGQFEGQIGFRFDNREINADVIETKSFSKLNSSFGMVYQNNKFTLRTNFSSGFRPPHLSEMLADGVHHGTNRYEKGSENLKSEFANQFDLSLDYNNEHLNINVNPFFNNFKNYIYVEPTADSVGLYQVYVYSQAPSAKTYGGELYLHYHPHFAHRLHIEQDFSYVIGEDNNNNPLPLIPQTRINTNLKYEFPETDKKFQFVTILLQRTQFLDKNDVSTFETTSEKYEVYNLEGNFSYNSKQSMLLKLGVRNLFNTTFVNHLSNLKGLGLPSPGINFYFSINYLIN